jgi:hypothetical protein
VRDRIDELEEDKRTGTDGYAEMALALDPKVSAKPAHDTKATGYVFTEDLGSTEKYKKDMIGILAGVRAGRTSPNGKANHTTSLRIQGQRQVTAGVTHQRTARLQ